VNTNVNQICNSNDIHMSKTQLKETVGERPEKMKEEN